MTPAARTSPTGGATRDARPYLSMALRDWAEIVGHANLVRDETKLGEAGTATFATTAAVQAIVRPANREEVQACVRVANQYGVPIYPVSSGKNWGYGSRVPVRDAALLDLSRLNRIIDFNEELAYVTIEPGVTQRQLHEFLRERKSRLWMDATGASPDCSIVGNTLERGFGHTPMGDHCATACGLEVVLPTGDSIETGFGRFDGGKVGPLSRWGVGPSLDGLFSQSSLGIVTRMSVWLMPAPECFQAFYFVCHDEDSLPAVIDALRPLRMNGTLRSLAHVGNDYKVLAATSQFPADETVTDGVLDREAMKRIRMKLGIGCWNGAGGLYGTRAQVREAKAQLRRALAGKVDRLQFVNDRLLGLLDLFATPVRLLTGIDVRRMLKVIAPVYGLMKGVPTDETLGSAYWRKKGPLPEQMDPDRDGCGLLWCSPVVPNTGADAAAVTALATRVLLAHGFEPQISISVATERSLIAVTTISYDRDVPGADRRARDCYDELVAELVSRGYPPYRLNVSSMDQGEAQAGYSRVLRALKSALDPAGILAPGRYDQGRSETHPVAASMGASRPEPVARRKADLASFLDAVLGCESECLESREPDRRSA